MSQAIQPNILCKGQRWGGTQGPLQRTGHVAEIAGGISYIKSITGRQGITFYKTSIR